MVGKESSLIEYGTVRSGTLSCDKSCRLLEFYAVLARSRSLGNADWLEYVGGGGDYDGSCGAWRRPEGMDICTTMHFAEISVIVHGSQLLFASPSMSIYWCSCLQTSSGICQCCSRQSTSRHGLSILFSHLDRCNRCQVVPNDHKYINDTSMHSITLT